MDRYTEYANAEMVISEIYNAKNKDPFGKKVLQKMVYLAQQKGAVLGYDFRLHFYGPYSAELDTDTMCLQAYGEVSCEHTSNGHLLSLAEPEVSVLSRPNLDDTTLESIRSVATRYSDWTPSSLELLSTAIYAYRYLDSQKGSLSKEDIVSKVQSIKGEKYTKKAIEEMLGEFEFYGISLN